MWRRLVIISFIVLSILNVHAQDSAASPDYFTEVFLDNASPYVGQQITYYFRFYDATGIPQPGYAPPDFEGFWQIADQQVQPSAQIINNRQYIVSELATVLYPTRPGEITIEGGIVHLPETVYRPQEELYTDMLVAQVKPLPDGALEGFSGAVGQFDLSATLDHPSAPLGEPITLQLTVSGTGNVEQLSLPVLPIPDGWRVYDNPITFRSYEANGQIIGEKVYEYLLFPDQIGLQTLPTLTLSYFDPSSIIYRSISTSPVTLEILPPQNVTAQSPLSADSPRIALALKPAPSIILNQSIYPGIGFWLIWLLPPLGFVLSGGYVVWRKRQTELEKLTRRSQAFAEAQRQLHVAQRTPPPEGYALIRMAIMTYLTSKLNRPLKSYSSANWEALIEKASIPAAMKEKLTACFEWTDEGQYAPGAVLNVSMLSNRAEEILRTVDDAWK